MILYALIARANDGVILVESIVSGVEGNYPQVSIQVLERIVSSSKVTSGVLGTTNAGNDAEELLPDGGRRTFVQPHDEPFFGGFMDALASGNCGFFSNSNANNADVESSGGEHNNNNNTAAKNGELDYYFHLTRNNNIICLCISDDMDIRYHMVNYNFLDDVKDKFTKMYSSHRIAKAKAYDMDKAFRRELGKLLHFYNENSKSMVRTEKVNHLLTKADDLKVLLGRNIKMTLEREDKLAMLVTQSEEMLSDTKVFTKRSSTLRTTMVRNNMSYYVYAFTFGVLVLYLFVGGICGYTFSKCGA